MAASLDDVIARIDWETFRNMASEKFSRRYFFSTSHGMVGHEERMDIRDSYFKKLDQMFAFPASLKYFDIEKRLEEAQTGSALAAAEIKLVN